MLDALNFELTQPTIKTFLLRCLKAAQCDAKVEFMANFLAELALLEYSFLKFSQSTIAAAAVSLALMTLGQGDGFYASSRVDASIPCRAWRF